MKRLELPRAEWLPPIQNVQIQTHSRCNADCLFCFSGDTQIITPDGDMPIRALVGTATLLVPGWNNGTSGGSGVWREASVRTFGVQRLLTLQLRRGSSCKTVRVTPEHRWVVRKFNRFTDGKPAQRHLATTAELRPGDKLVSCYAANSHTSAHKIRPSAIGVAQGFTFGDGSRTENDHRPAYADLHGEKYTALLAYFGSAHRARVKVNGKLVWRVCDLPRSWKEPPCLDESKSFLLGWLAGYFAADGHVAANGRQATLYSARAENIHLIRTICYRLGLQVSPAHVKVRVGFGERRPLHYVSIRVGDVPEEFWICAHHRARVRAMTTQRKRLERRLDWKVVAVTDSDECEEVFCATVPEFECFTLADNLLTMNCPYIESEHAADPGTMPDDLWHLILSNLRPFTDGLNKGKICPYLMQEPLIDKTIFAKIQDLYRCFPQTMVEISTNGAALTDKVVDRLFECFAGRRHELWVSHHGIDAATFQHIMKIDYEKATANLVNALKKSNGRFRVKIRGAGESRDGKHTIFTAQQYKDYMAKLFRDHGINTKNVEVDAFTFHDRAGTLHRTDRGANLLKVGKVRDIDPQHPFSCTRLDEWLHFDYKGDIVLCCMDYHAEVKLPNIRDMSLLDYFQSHEYIDLVMKVSGRVKAPDGFICTRCLSPGG